MFHHMMVHFQKDSEGNRDPNSDLITEEIFRVLYTYVNKTQFCSGVVKVELLDRVIEGQGCKVFDYMAK